ncbi:MAG TPA: hypothetical protein VFR58_16350 [Flavisolibacter sp.]|nr:hypothetical protein [Flavisolibacter sp.]
MQKLLFSVICLVLSFCGDAQTLDGVNPEHLYRYPPGRSVIDSNSIDGVLRCFYAGNDAYCYAHNDQTGRPSVIMPDISFFGTAGNDYVDTRHYSRLIRLSIPCTCYFVSNGFPFIPYAVKPYMHGKKRPVW